MPRRKRLIASRAVASLLIALLLASCGPSARRADEYPLSESVFRLRHGGLSGSVPAGWSASGPAGQNGGSDSAPAMTLSGGDSLSIVFRRVTPDSAAAAYFRKRGVTDLAMLTRTLRDSTVGNVRDGIETFKSGGREFAEYDARANGRKVRVAVFRAGDFFYECEAAAVKPLKAPRSYDGLFAAHRAVLRSLR